MLEEMTLCEEVFHSPSGIAFAVLSAVGSLSPQVLGPGTEVYDPMTHYQQVRDAWVGVRIPDGR
jgi:outer membrane protein